MEDPWSLNQRWFFSLLVAIYVDTVLLSCEGMSPTKMAERTLQRSIFGGPVCADFVAKNLHLKLLKHLSSKSLDIVRSSVSAHTAGI